MVAVLHMTQLMQHNVARKVRRQKKQFGVEADPESRGAAAPPAALVTHLNTGNAHSMPACQLPAKGNQMALAQAYEPALQEQRAESNLSGWKKDAQRISVRMKLSPMAILIAHGIFAVQEGQWNRFGERVLTRRLVAGAQICQAGQDPLPMAFKYARNLGCRNPVWKDDLKPHARAHLEPDLARTSAASHGDGNGLPDHTKKGGLRRPSLYQILER